MNFKKIFFSLLILGVFIFLVSLVFALYDSSTGKAEFKLKPGWNTLPFFIADNIENNCNFSGGEFAGVAWMWSPTNNEWILLGPQTEALERAKVDFDNGYYYTIYGGFFIYLLKECEFFINDYDKIGPRNFKIAPGWQFIAKSPKISEKGFSVFKSCNIEKFNKWDSETQNWFYKPSNPSTDELKKEFDQAEIGEVFIVKFSNTCELDVIIENRTMENLMPSPPPLE